MIRSAALLAVALTALVAHTAPVRADDTYDYVVKKDGESCYSIATRELGDRSMLPVLHRLNPQLGPLPHNLRAGQILKLPKQVVAPDAHLTGASGSVRVRKAAETVWDAARRGMELFRAWRVGAEDRSSAELTFRDDDRLALRENTIVIIYGPEKVRARLTPGQAVLEQGTLRSRLGDLSPTLRVTTPTAIATIGGGSALVGVIELGGAGGTASTVANHDGRSAVLTSKVGGTVKVASGMGSRVLAGKRPEKPRKLVPPPAWDGPDPIAFAALAADGANVTAAWTRQPKAAWYRLEVLAPSGTVVAAVEVPANVNRFELVRVPVGHYQARVSSIDADRLEGRPSSLLAMTVLPVAIRAPGAAVVAAPAVLDADAIDGDRRLDGGGAAVPAPRVALGGTVGDDQLRCATGAATGSAIGLGGVAAPSAIARLAAPGRAEVRCTTADGLVLAPFTVDVVGVIADAPPPAAAAAPAPPAPPLAPPVHAPRWTAGGFLGWTHLPTGPIEGYALGDAPIDSYQLASGTALGVRVARWFDPDLFAELELRVIGSTYAGADEQAWIGGGHALLGVRLADSRRLEVRTVIGGGGHALLAGNRYARRDLELDVVWGLTAAIPLRGDFTLRLDGRQHIAGDRAGGVTDLLEVSVGLETVLARQ